MTLLSSLTSRIFAAIAGVTVLSIAISTYYAVAAVTDQAEGELRRGVAEAERLVQEYRQLVVEHFGREARLVADLPLLKAAVETNDPPTVRPIAEELRQQLGASELVVANRRGEILARTGTADEQGLLQQVSAPIWIDRTAPRILGTLTVGFWLDHRIATRFRELTNSEIAFGSGDRIHTSTLEPSVWEALKPLLRRDGITPSVRIGAVDYIASTVELTPEGGASPAQALILRSRTERLAFLPAVYRSVSLIAAGAVLVAVLAGYAVARTVTRPIRAVVAAMREMGSTGDLSQRLRLPSRTPLQDEDARVLATTFNAMTGSIARFQREATQRERLSSLGRLSAIIAHEIRNPLMIIKANVRTLRSDAASRTDVQAAASDIDEEVGRLNRIVTQVLDFAKPITFDVKPVDLNALCRDAVRAVWPAGDPDAVRLELQPDPLTVVTDPDRLRLALVNLLTNARQASEGRGRAAAAVGVRTRVQADRVVVEVRDDGPGIAPEHAGRIFDPFFTTRTNGTGLGLPLTRNIVEGLGGTISITSDHGRGTCAMIDLPAAAARLTP